MIFFIECSDGNIIFLFYGIIILGTLPRCVNPVNHQTPPPIFSHFIFSTDLDESQKWP